MAKLIINESSLNRLVRYERLTEEITKKDITDFIKNDPDFKGRVKDIVKSDKDIEKKIKNIVADVLNKFFKTLWQRSNFLDSELRN